MNQNMRGFYPLVYAPLLDVGTAVCRVPEAEIVSFQEIKLGNVSVRLIRDSMFTSGFVAPPRGLLPEATMVCISPWSGEERSTAFSALVKCLEQWMFVGLHTDLLLTDYWRLKSAKGDEGDFESLDRDFIHPLSESGLWFQTVTRSGRPILNLSKTEKGIPCGLRLVPPSKTWKRILNPPKPNHTGTATVH